MSNRRRVRREQARELAKEIVRTGSLSTERGVRSLDLALWFLAATLALVLFLLAPKGGGAVTIVCLLAIIGLLVHPVFQLPWIRSAPSPNSRIDRYVISMLLVALLVGGFGFYVWPESANGFPSPAYITDHSLSRKGPGSFSAIIRVQGSANSAKYARDNYIIVIARSPDNAIDPHVDKVIDKSKAFQTPSAGQSVTMEVPLSQGTLDRLYRTQALDFYLFMLPNGVQESQLATIKDMGLRGGIGLDYKGMQGVFSHLTP